MVDLPVLISPLLDHAHLTHAFFTRQGGVSQGLYASLNGGVGSRDDPACVAENRARMSAQLGVAPSHLLVPYQVHSAVAVIVERPFAPAERPRCDALVTATPGLALGVTGADCGMILFADIKAGVIGAAHAGWKGALTGVLEATIASMQQCGAKPASICAVLGPMIGASSYEVGPEFVARFIDASAANATFFAPAERSSHSLFDLPGFIASRLKAAGVGLFADLAQDTYTQPDAFFSYRRATHEAAPDYGRLVGAIALRGRASAA